MSYKAVGSFDGLRRAGGADVSFSDAGDPASQGMAAARKESDIRMKIKKLENELASATTPTQRNFIKGQLARLDDMLKNGSYADADPKTELDAMRAKLIAKYGKNWSQKATHEEAQAWAKLFDEVNK
jgi:hypothetical protein